MITLVSGLFLAAAPAAPLPTGDLLAIRVGRAETVSEGPIDHAVVLVEGGKIVAVGEDLPVERGIPILDRPEWTLTPGLVNPYSRAGMDGQAGRAKRPQASAADELFAGQDVYREILEAGVTTLGLYPAGTGFPGQAIVVRPRGESAEEMILAEGAYLKITLESDAKSKKDLRDAFEEVDEYEEEVAKAREKWEKEQEKKKKKKKSSRSSRSKSKDDEEKDKDENGGEEEKDEKKEEDDDKKGKDDEEGDVFVAPEPKPEVVPFIDLREQRLAALFRIQKAGDLLHLLDVIEEEDVRWSLRVPLRHDIDLYEVAEEIGERELVCVLTAMITYQPNTRRERNIPAELARAGAKVALTPRQDDGEGHERWIREVGYLVAQGLDRQAALAAMTLEGARALGLEERLGSIEAGKDANLVFWSGDPFEAGSRVEAVMLEGELVEEVER